MMNSWEKIISARPVVFLLSRIFPWQKFVIGLHDCTYWKDTGLPRWPDLFCELGRGAGKDGTIAWESVCLMSPYNGIREYDVDICANNEDQAMRPVRDVIAAFEQPEYIKKLKRFFYWTKEQVVSLKTRSQMKGRTNSPKGKDGLRLESAFSTRFISMRIRQYQCFYNRPGKAKSIQEDPTIQQTGMSGKGLWMICWKHQKKSFEGGEPDNGLLPFICKLNQKRKM